ncbi:hypothetical protein [Frigoribacterium sp. CFBP 13712]|uniref:hypothetical protein n=1 Tax=Frigoribacterium sp. CFBP 13712 TaxID=2775309 RepID=UPI001780FCD8|nr:hypothetical protein [Frigoribacterium sp. CFBP 13712]MBD8702839.1 hypothetical protein [Frigoribacterium sp. CFBP 13712]
MTRMIFLTIREGYDQAIAAQFQTGVCSGRAQSLEAAEEVAPWGAPWGIGQRSAPMILSDAERGFECLGANLRDMVQA